MAIRAIAAGTFDDAPVDIETPNVVTRDGWELTITHATEWAVDATKDGAVLPMRMSHGWDTSQVAAYVTEQIRLLEDQLTEAGQ